MDFNYIELPSTADFHVHLRDGIMMETVTPMIRKGGVDIAYVMPNLDPPITTVAAALSYQKRLQALAPDVKFLMTLYLHSSITPATIAEAAEAGIAGVKAYPSGTTTNSSAGVLDWKQHYPVFEAMQTHDLVLNLHGEVPSSSSVEQKADLGEVSVLNAEALFMPTLRKLHADFPLLRIVLEHCSTKEALDAVRACGPNVGATITAHHLWIVLDDVCGDVFNFCKPIAKKKSDRIALIKAVVEDKTGKFFFGSDSAPHSLEAKKGGKKAAAGCFTQGWATQLVIAAVEEALQKEWVNKQDVSISALRAFLSVNGRKFYRVSGEEAAQRIVIERKGETIPPSIHSIDRSIDVIPFKSGDEVMSLRWVAS